MICSTLELTEYIKKDYISKGRQLKGAEFLERVLYANSEYRNYITLIKSRLHHHHIEEMLYVTNDRTGINRSIKNLLDLLLYIEQQQGPKILIKNDPEVQRNISSLESGRSLVSKSGQSAKTKGEKSKFGIKYFFILIIAIGVFNIIYTSYKSDKKPIAKKSFLFTAVEAIITDDYSKLGYWAVWHTSFKELDAALRDKESTLTYHPGIKIVKLSDERFHLFEFTDSQEEAANMISKRTLRHWPEERVVFVNSEICVFKELRNDPYYICE